MSEAFDAIVIGTGQAGPALAVRLAEAGQRVAVIERKWFGGTCVNTGCIPTKSMVASAYAAHMARRLGDYGVAAAGPIRVDMEQVWRRTRGISEQSRDSVRQWLEGTAGVTVLRGHARLLEPGLVALEERRLSAPRIFLNVGGRAQIPALQGIEQVAYLTNSSLMDLRQLPEHLLIIGGSYIGLEFAQMFRRFGARVSVIERGTRLLPHEDEDVSAAVAALLAAEDIGVHLGAECIRLENIDERVRVHARAGAQDSWIEGSHLLLATGRVPNTDDLGLDAVGMRRDARGYIEVDEQCRSSVAGIWALGDCNGRGGFTHTAYNDYEIVAANLLDDDPRRISDRIPAYALYLDPPLARIGLSERAAREAGHRILLGTRPMSRVGRAVERGETTGFIKIIADADSGLLLGASLFGVNGDEAIHCLLDTMYAKAPWQTVARAVHIHPTVAELLPTVLQSMRPA